jgi:hypothetical protein
MTEAPVAASHGRLATPAAIFALALLYLAWYYYHLLAALL